MAALGKRKDQSFKRRMIGKQDILDRAQEWQLSPNVVEKDYVLGWLLVGLYLVPEIAEHWIFKGGTCIKKCFFETYRFSEDLDFSLLPQAAYSLDEIRELLAAATTKASELCGIEFPTDLVEVRPRQNRQGQPTFLGVVSYRGPLQMPIGSLPRVRFDLTQHEVVLDRPSPRTPFHPYPDDLPEGVPVHTYSLDELLAEKCRALYERTRPRDLYDVVFLLENQPEGFDLHHVREFFGGKCEAKSLLVPTSAGLIQTIRSAEELVSEWENMLGHQLPQIPRLDSLMERLEGILAWIDEPAAVPAAARLARDPIAAAAGRAVAPAGIQYWGQSVPLETLRFAGANRLLVEFDYNGKLRSVEPYSLRRASTGNVLLYGWERGSTHIKAYKTAKIVNLRATREGFHPRYRVEFTAAGPVTVPPAATKSRRATSGPRQRRPPSSSDGPKYIFECTYCGKHFRRSKCNSRLRKHKTQDGWDCPGRHGYLVDTLW